MSDVYEDSIELHRQQGGKLEVKSKVAITNKDELSLAYTPGVGGVSRAVAEDKSLARELTIKKNTVAVVSDGSAVLGLGNIGPEGALPVMEGKAALFKEFGGVDAFPICLDTQDAEEIIKTVKYLAPVFGGINLEDIGAPRCFEIETRLRTELDIPVFHDDQHGTAIVVLAGLINALKLASIDKSEAKVVINGAGAAGIAIAKLLLNYGFQHITMCDSKGAINESRTDLTDVKKEILELTKTGQQSCNSLEEAMQGSDVFIGVSQPDLVTADMVKGMNDKPIIFAMSNPVPEIMPDVAKEAGAFVVGTGRSDFPNQINNVLAFPGIFRGALDNEIKQFTDEMLIKAAENLASAVEDISVDKVLPPVFDKSVVEKVSAAIK